MCYLKSEPGYYLKSEPL